VLGRHSTHRCSKACVLVLPCAQVRQLALSSSCATRARVAGALLLALGNDPDEPVALATAPPDTAHGSEARDSLEEALALTHLTRVPRHPDSRSVFELALALGEAVIRLGNFDVVRCCAARGWRTRTRSRARHRSSIATMGRSATSVCMGLCDGLC
jgi:hypothetical protein